MKLSNPIAIKLVALLLSWAVRLWLSTTDFRFLLEDPSCDPRRRGRRCLYLFWHEVLLGPAYTHSRHRIAILVSRHRDGELIAQVVRMLGGLAIRGSTTRGGATALRQMMRRGQLEHLAITPDGPRGPRRRVQLGPVYLASRTGMLVVPVGFGFQAPWRAGSWDRMALPKPGRRARCVVGRPIELPPGLDRAGLQQYRATIQAAMDDVQARAERLAETGAEEGELIGLSEFAASGRPIPCGVADEL